MVALTCAEDGSSPVRPRAEGTSGALGGAGPTLGTPRVPPLAGGIPDHRPGPERERQPAPLPGGHGPHPQRQRGDSGTVGTRGVWGGDMVVTWPRGWGRDGAGTGTRTGVACAWTGDRDGDRGGNGHSDGHGHRDSVGDRVDAQKGWGDPKVGMGILGVLVNAGGVRGPPDASQGCLGLWGRFGDRRGCVWEPRGVFWDVGSIWGVWGARGPPGCPGPAGDPRGSWLRCTRWCSAPRPRTRTGTRSCTSSTRPR